MAEIISPSVPKPIAGAAIEAAQVTDWLNAIIDFIHGTEIDQNNVDLTGETGLVGKSTAQTITGAKTFDNTGPANTGVRAGITLSATPGSDTPTANDGLEIAFQGLDASRNPTAYGNLQVVYNDVTATSEDSEFVFKTLINASSTEVFSVGSQGAIFNDASKNIDFRIETDNIANGFHVDADLDTFSFGAAAADDKFVTISPPAASHTADTDTYALHVTAGGAQTIPDGTTALVASLAVEEPNITATGTVTNAATVYIKSAPDEGDTGNYALWIDAGASQLDGTLTVGANTDGHDVKLFGNSSGQYMLWDESADELVLAGDTKLSFHDAAGGENIIASADGHLEINAGTTLDITAPTVDLNSATEFNIDTAAYDLNASGAVTIDSSGSMITLDAETDIVLDANGADIILKDDGTVFGKLTNNSGELRIASSSSNTTALSFAGANATFAGTVGSGAITSTGVVTGTGFTIGSTAITSTAAEINLLDGSAANTVVNSKAVIYGSGGELSGSSLTVDDVAVDGKVITMTGSASDTAVFTAGTDGALSIVTTDAAAAAANIQITADGTAELAGTTVTLDSSGGVTLDAGGGTITFADDGASLGTITSAGLTTSALDISGNADIAGTLEADAYTVDGATLAEYITDTTGAMFSSNTESGITVTFQDGDNTIDLSVDAAQTGITSLLATDIKIGEDDETKIDFESANEIHFYAGSALAITIDGNGAVGIGTAPERFLHLKDANPTIRFEDENDGAQDYDICVDGNGFSIRDVNASEAYRLTVDEAGSVGIGTAAPLGNLPVQESAVTVAEGIDEDGDNLIVMNDGASGISVISSDTTAGKLIFGSASDKMGASVVWYHNSNEMYVGTNHDDATLSLRTGQSGEGIHIDENQNVGVGTSAPDLISNSNYPNVLTVFGSTTGNDRASLELVSRRSGAASEVGRLSFWNSEAAGNRLIAGIIAETAESGESYATESGQLGFYTTTTASSGSGVFTERMRINSNGNVGIGTTEPASTLSVDSGTTDDIFRLRNEHALLTIQASVDNEINIYGWDEAGAGGGSSAIRFQNATQSNPSLYLSADSEKVGIGTATPEEKLTIKAGGTTGQEIIKIRDSGNTEKIVLGLDSSGYGQILFNPDVGVLMTTGNANQLHLDTNGKVGVGMVPTYGLDLKGPDVNTYCARFATSDGNGIVVGDWGGTNAIVSTTGAQRLDLGTGGGANMTLIHGGPALIGTTTTNGNMTKGLTIDQGTNDDETLALKSTGDVAHGLISQAETNSYLIIKKSHGDYGGTTIRSMGEDDPNLTTALGFQVFGGTANIAKTTSAIGLADFYISEHNGSNSLADITGEGNVFTIRAVVGGSGLTRFMVDEDGDMYSATAGQTFDNYDDVALLSAYDKTVSPKSVIESEFEDFAKYNEDSLVDCGILGAPVADGGMVNVTQLQRLHNGAIRQLGRQLAETREALKETQQKLMRLEAA